GHPAVSSTHRYLRRLLWWPRSRADVKSVIRSCHPCQVSASLSNRQHEAHLWTPSEPFEVLGLDIVGPMLPSSKGERWVLTSTDLLSRFTLLFPLADISTNTICRVIETQVLLRFGTPSTFITDQGRQFTLSPRFDALCCLYSAHHIVLPVAHAASGGFYERQHRTLGDSLRRLLRSHQRAAWVDLLCIAEGRLNSMPDPELGISPHEILFGFKLKLPFD
ncbi:retrovirus polyprotein, putative, partial [Perkinsus marinus ATCC 50983]